MKVQEINTKGASHERTSKPFPPWVDLSGYLALFALKVTLVKELSSFTAMNWPIELDLIAVLLKNLESLTLKYESPMILSTPFYNAKFYLYSEPESSK